MKAHQMSKTEEKRANPVPPAVEIKLREVQGDGMSGIPAVRLRPVICSALASPIENAVESD